MVNLDNSHPASKILEYNNLAVGQAPSLFTAKVDKVFWLQHPVNAANHELLSLKT